MKTPGAIDGRRSTAARMLQVAERDGLVDDTIPRERQACLRLNAVGLLRRDLKLASRWYPVETAMRSEVRP
ncbi:hypothetical protein [Rhizobium lentis]|uniref:Uncharacterized protein n=1 Tax=Rhizobium lentis TaxID=1138194 RepID=A0A7W8XE94_9HYPH|nr:hypothetical protein [Rhizobium lentis]MBB4574416.1 hypothetical protein [Rhizobium lentis]MBB5550342.1 hypothetical protein [Rhizobium lentis]MBB5560629.1 hypothetical protein [Rhizobium lentis]MBB5567214.1 hypothetical protein [Rhizobium lentis]